MKSSFLVIAAFLTWSVAFSASGAVVETNPEVFRFEHAGESWVGVYLVADPGLPSAAYGPIVLCPLRLAQRVSAGRDISGDLTGYGSPTKFRIDLYRWHIKCDDVTIRVPKSGFYSVTSAGENLVVSPLEIEVPEVGATPSERTKALLMSIGKSALSE